MSITYLEAIRAAQAKALADDPRVFIYGQDIAAFGGAITALLVFLLSLPHPDWIALGVFVAIGGSLIFWELRARHPFFDVRLLASNLPLTRTYLRFALATFCLYTVLYGVTGWFEASRGMSSQEAGLLLLPTAAIGALVVVPISRRNLVRVPLVISAGSCLVGSAGVMLLTTGTPIARIVGGATAGVEPRIMGFGPAPATRKLCARVGVKPIDFDVIELNEAFAAQALAVLRDLGIADDAPHVNPNGGAIALGHPLGASGARLAGTAALELSITKAKRALATMCIGVGQGIALALEAV